MGLLKEIAEHFKAHVQENHERSHPNADGGLKGTASPEI